ncbi:MAG: rod shape-determining protein MreD, partial [Candidatus Omnitrophica bacterium]|nr:rod shape-determining protein MreD [Candidatus Omnitrophota bacterium]
MKKEACLFIALLIFILLEATVLNKFKVFGVTPDLLLTSVVVFGLFLPSFRVIVLSCFAGLLLDLFYVGHFGMNIIMFASLGIILRKLAKNLYIENSIIIIAVVFIASLSLGLIRRLYVAPVPF